jgi:hypothetical protein
MVYEVFLQSHARLWGAHPFGQSRKPQSLDANFPTGAQMVSGAEDAQRAVRDI